MGDPLLVGCCLFCLFVDVRVEMFAKKLKIGRIFYSITSRLVSKHSFADMIVACLQCPQAP